MTDLIVADTGPLIALSRIGHLGLLQALYSAVRIPAAVLGELHIDSDRPGAIHLKVELENGWIEIGQLAAGSEAVLRELLLLVDVGEAEAILLAEQRSCRFLLIDDRRGRMIAKRRGIPVVGVGGVLLAAKKRGLIDNVTQLTTSLAQTGYRLSSTLVDELRRLAAE